MSGVQETATFTMYSRIVSVGVKSMASAAMTSVARRSSFLPVKTPPTVAGNPEELEFSEHWSCLVGGPACVAGCRRKRLAFKPRVAAENSRRHRAALGCACCDN